MKKIWKSLFIVALGAFTFSSCEDVQEPYDLPGNNEGNEPPVEINYIYKETVGTESVSSPYPYVDAYNSWTKEGSGASTVTYSGTKSTVRGSGLSSGSAKNFNGSGPNVVFFGTAPSSFIINKISLTSTQTKLKLQFGASSSINVDNSGTYNNTFDTNNFIVSLSGDGNTWVPITYTKDNGDESNPYWIYATADFTLKEATGELYIKFEASISSAIRLDDITLIEGEGGQEITLVGGTTPPEDATPITISDLIGKMTSDGAVIDATTNRYFEAVVQNNVADGNYTSNNLCVAEEGATKAGQGIILYGSQVDPKTLGLTQGDKVKITLMANAAKAQDYKGMYEVTGSKDATWCKIEKIGTASISPVSLSTTDIANLINYQGMTVTVKNASTTESNTWGSGTHTFISDNAQFVVYANSTCTFANRSINNTKTGNLTGVVSVYNNVAQIVPRSANDIADFIGEGDDNEGNEGGDTPEPGNVGTINGNTITFSFKDFGVEHGKPFSSVLALSDGTTLNFNKESGTSEPAYYDNASYGDAARMYAQNSLTITSTKTIASIDMTLGTNNDKLANGNETMEVNPGTLNREDKAITISNINNKSIKITNTHTANSGGTQLRIISMKITYAE